MWGSLRDLVFPWQSADDRRVRGHFWEPGLHLTARDRMGLRSGSGRNHGIPSMRSLPGRCPLCRVRRARAFPRNLEPLESRVLMADGITPAPGPPIDAVAGVPIRDAIFARYSVTDPTGGPGDQWRAHVNFGDGQGDGPVIPIQKGDEFEFRDTHTYLSPGTYTVTVMIALPGSHTPNDNIVTTQVTVAPPGGTPKSSPPPPRRIHDSRRPA